MLLYSFQYIDLVKSKIFELCFVFKSIFPVALTVNSTNKNKNKNKK